MMRSLICLTALTLALGLTACGDDGNEPTTTNPTNNPTPGTMSDGTSVGATDGTTTDATTTTPTTTDAMTTPGTDPTTDGTTNPTTDGTTTDPTVGETTVDPTDGTTDGTTTAGVEGLYGPCEMAMPPCAGDQVCLMVTGIDGNFCAPSCADADCPAAPDGVVAQPMCVLSAMGEMEPSSCALICNPMGGADDCGPGLTCKMVPMMQIGLCTAP